MPVLPAWSVEDCVTEIERLAGLGFLGVNMTSDPQDASAPDLASRVWDPVCGSCAPIGRCRSTSIGASLTSLNFYGKYFWPSVHQNLKPAIGGAMLFLNNARMVINSIYAGIFDKLGEDCLMFETDFPHPTWMYPNPLETVEERMLALRPETRRKVWELLLMGDAIDADEAHAPPIVTAVKDKVRADQA